MKSLHKTIMLALLLLTGACGSMLDIEPHSAVSPTVVGPDDIDALRMGMYNKVQEGPTYYSYIAFDLFGGELMTSTADRSDKLALQRAAHVRQQPVERLLQGAPASKQRHVDCRRTGRQPFEKPRAG